MARVVALILFSLFALAGFPGSAVRAADDCPAGNLLDSGQIGQSFGVIREQRLTDGRTPGEGADVNDYSATLFMQPGAFVLFDLGRTQDISAIDVVTDDYASPLLEWSADGTSYSPVPLDKARQLRSHIRQRWGEGLGLQARYLRLRPDSQGQVRAVTEIRAFCQRPGGFPSSPVLREAGSFQADVKILQDRNKALNLVSFLIVLLGAGLVVWMKRLDSRKRKALALIVVIVGSGGWIRFGYFAGAGDLLHPHELTHYYLGAKYFPELGYRELYRCIARSERENGRGFMVERTEIRDLDNYVGHPGSWAGTEEGRCRAEFSPERWQAFKADVDRMRRLFVRRHFHGILKDHGYNATPLHTAWLEAVTNALPDTRGTLNFFAVLDIAMVVGAIAAMWWGFGPAAGAVAALTLGFSDLSSYDWIGGSIGRSAWLLSLCAGLACLKRGQSAVGAGLVTLAALLRLIPVVFLGALGLYVLVRILQARRLDREGRHIVAGIAVTLAAGLFIPLLAFGGEVYDAFWRNTLLHSGNDSLNRLGLVVLLEALGSSGWLATAVKGTAVLLGILYIGYLARLGRPAWSLVPLGGLLIFGALGLGYDYAWLVMLAPFAQLSSLSAVLLLAFVAMTAPVASFLPVREAFILLSVAMLGVLPAVAWLGHKAIGPMFGRSPGGT